MDRYSSIFKDNLLFSTDLYFQGDNDPNLDLSIEILYITKYLSTSIQSPKLNYNAKLRAYL